MRFGIIRPLSFVFNWNTSIGGVLGIVFDGEREAGKLSQVVSLSFLDPELLPGRRFGGWEV